LRLSVESPNGQLITELMLLAFSWKALVLFVVLISTQILSLSLLPRTAGFTNVTWTLACLAIYISSTWCLAYIIHAGIPLSVMIPLLAAVVPLATIAVGVIFYHEAASVLRITLLCSACAIIGIASGVR
jgi:multidrug transporter EmrE-like cation transporter